MTTPRPYLLLYAAAAAWIAFSGIHRGHNADTFIFSLISLDAWMPFFWEQDRVGMLVPLVASACRDPLWNLVLQTGLTTFAGLCLPLLLAELVYPHPVGRAAATLASAAMIALAPDRIRANLLFECCYPLAMALGCAGLLVLGRGPGWPRWWRVVVAAGALVLACWAYIGVPIWLGPLALVRGWLQPGEPWPARWWRRLVRPALHPRTVAGCALIVAAFGVGYWGMKQARWSNPDLIGETPKAGLPPGAWVASWRKFVDHFDRFPEMATWEYTLLAAAAAGAIAAVVRWRRPAYPILSGVLVLLVPAAVEFLFIGTRSWTALNDHHPRYVLGSLVSAQTCLALVAVLPLARVAAGRGRRVVGVGAALALFGAATAQFGFPSPDRPRREVERVAGRWTADLLAANVDAVGGDYWQVWPAVYHMNMVRRAHGDGRIFPGVVLRGLVLLHWSGLQREELRVAVWNDGDQRAHFYQSAVNLGLNVPVKIGEHGPFEIYRIRATDAR